MWLLYHQSDKTETKSPLDYIHPVHTVTHLGMIGAAVQVHGHVIMVRETAIMIPTVLVHWYVVVTIVVTEAWIVVPMVHTPQVLAQVPAHMAHQVLQDPQDPLDHQGHLVTKETLDPRVTLDKKETRETKEILVHKVQLVQLAQGGTGAIQGTRETKGTRATKAILEQLGLKV